MVNRMGSGFVNDLQEKTGCTDDEAMRAYAAVRDVFDLERYWREVERLDGKAPYATQVALLLEARKLVESATLWVLRNEPGPIDVSAAVRRFGARVARLKELLPDALGGKAREEYEANLSAPLLRGASIELVRFYAARRDLECALDVASLAERFSKPVETVSRLYFAAREALDISLLKASAASITCNNSMESMAVIGLLDQLGDAFMRLVGRFIARPDGQGREPFEDFLAAKSHQKDRLLDLAASLRRGEPPSLAILAVVVQTLSALAGN